MTREVSALIAQMPFILYALLSLAVVIAVPHSQWNLLAVAAPYFLGPTISKRYTTLRDTTLRRPGPGTNYPEHGSTGFPEHRY